MLSRVAVSTARHAVRVSAQAARAMSSSVGTPLSDFSEENEMLREAIADFAKDAVAPKSAAMDRDAKTDPEVLQGLFDMGLMGIEIPEEHGGAGMDFMSAIIAVEELAKVDPGISVICDVHNTLVNTMFMQYGSDELKKEWLPKLATDTIGSFCISEPGSGSDAFALKTTAVKDGDDYILNGSKAWITNAAQAGVFLVMANANPEAGYRGITCFAIPADTPGLTVGKKEDKLGIRSSTTNPVILEDVRIPATNVIGEVGKGYKYAISCLNEGRIGIGAQMLGLAQGVYDMTLPYLWERKQFGQSVADFQGLSFQMAEVAVELECARNLVYNAARLREAGKPFVKEAAMAKLKASKVAELTTSKCVEWCGGVGFTKEFPQERFYRDAPIGRIYEGTSNLQLITIAKALKDQYKA